MNKEIMKQLGFSKQVNDVENNICPFFFFLININDFKNYISIKEYNISGLCQRCQDEIFN